MTGFWVEGYQALRKALRDEFERKALELERLLEETSDRRERQRIIDQLCELKREYRSRIRRIAEFLF